ncbi:hypothetical protein RHMOL_Rhmol01G0040300 [Rhododendron molle]|uniref:Uncharacterized protein n=1 Tax=Rhododendron molle TaxID=49168 RepID=A0ACC0PZS6_RHOML|nr:hypothetical protein RHMOL_Rhmol01G0040300 [Rhododendron molle]
METYSQKSHKDYHSAVEKCSQVTTLISNAEKLEELIKNPPPSEADVEVAKLLVMEKGEAIAQLKAKANKETISAAVAN